MNIYFNLYPLKNGQYVLKTHNRVLSLYYLIKTKDHNKLFKIERRLSLKMHNQNQLNRIEETLIMNSLSLPITSHYYNLKDLMKIIELDFQTLYSNTIFKNK